METHTLTHARPHTRARQQALISLSAAPPKRTKCLKWTRIRKADLHRSAHAMLITQVSRPRLCFSKVVETWGWWLQPWSKHVKSGLKTPQRKRSLSVNRRQHNIRQHSPWYHNYRRDVRVFPRCVANPADGNGALLLWMAFLRYHSGLNNKVAARCGHRDCLSLTTFVDYSMSPSKTFFFVTERGIKTEKPHMSVYSCRKV